MRATPFLFLSRLATALLLFLFLSTASALAGPAPLTGELGEILQNATPEELIPVTVVLEQNVSRETLTAVRKGLSRLDARKAVCAYLRTVSRESQASLLTHLEQRKRESRVERIRSLWLANVVGVRATGDVIRELQSHPGVARINYDIPRQGVFIDDHEPLEGGPAGVMPERTEIAWGIPWIGADQVWDMGYDGSGIVVAMVDSGTDYTHSDLADHLWTNRDEIPGNGIDDDRNGYIDDIIGYDFGDDDNDPMDQDGHGTHTAGTVAGDGTGGVLTGVAPGARIMICKVGLYINDVDEISTWEGFQYAADNNADVLSVSLGWFHSWDPDRATWREVCENVIAAGSVMVVASGNEQHWAGAPDDVRTPGDVPAVITVGATSYKSDVIANFSSEGPVTWQDVSPYSDHPYPPGLIKPDVCAPGQRVKSTIVHGGYSGESWSGTSMATPHVAGLVALMLESNPNLGHAEIKAVLESTAVDLGDPGDDNYYGMGKIQAVEAVTTVMAPSGTVAGYVSDIHAGTPVPAHIRVAGMTKDADATMYGLYTMRLVSGETYTLVASYFGYYPSQGQVDIQEGVQSQLDFQLMKQPVGTLEGTVSSAEGTALEGAEVLVVGAPLDPVTTDQDGLFTIELPGGDDYTIEVHTYGFEKTSVSEISVTPGQSTVRDVALDPWPPVLILEYDRTPTSGAAISEALRYNGYDHFISREDLSFFGDLSYFDAVFILLGIMPHNYTIPEHSEKALVIRDYLAQGGNVYMEGGDTWVWDVYYGHGYNFNPLFGVIGTSDGDSSWFDVLGIPGTFTAQMDFFYDGEAYYNDIIRPSPPAFRIFQDYEYGQGRGVAYYNAEWGYRTIAVTFEFGGLRDSGLPSTKVNLAAEIMNFFGIEPPDCFEEVCDGKDNDCDEEIDEGFDQDEDGYKTCDGDCDDADSIINPGAEEICEDGIDNNCDGRVDEGCGTPPCGVLISSSGNTTIRLVYLFIMALPLFAAWVRRTI